MSTERNTVEQFLGCILFAIFLQDCSALRFHRCSETNPTTRQFTIDECSAGQVMLIRSAIVGYSAAYNPNQTPLNCPADTPQCQRATDVPRTQCDGKQTCSFSQGVVLFPQSGVLALCVLHRDGNYVRVELDCVTAPVPTTIAMTTTPLPSSSFVSMTTSHLATTGAVTATRTSLTTAKAFVTTTATTATTTTSAFSEATTTEYAALSTLPPRECKETLAGREYKGTVNTTLTGKDCQAWTSSTPHDIANEHQDSEFPGGSRNASKNYCRNPKGWSKGPWCYTTDPAKRFDFCDIPLCPGPECRKTPAGREYRGTVNETVSGKKCQTWSLDTPHSQTASLPDEEFPDGSKSAAKNFCRNPDNEQLNGVWCYTVDANTTWEFCDVPLCNQTTTAAQTTTPLTTAQTTSPLTTDATSLETDATTLSNISWFNTSPPGGSTSMQNTTESVTTSIPASTGATMAAVVGLAVTGSLIAVTCVAAWQSSRAAGKAASTFGKAAFQQQQPGRVRPQRPPYHYFPRRYVPRPRVTRSGPAKMPISYW